MVCRPVANAPLAPIVPNHVTYAESELDGAKYCSVTVVYGVKLEPLSVIAVFPLVAEGVAESRPCGIGLGDRVGVAFGLGVGDGLGLGDAFATGVGELSAVSEMTRKEADLWHVPFQQIRMV